MIEGITLGELALIVALLTQFAGFIWGASKISSNLGSLKEALESLTSSVKHLDARVHDHEVRVSVLERVDSLRPRPRASTVADVREFDD